MTMLVEGDIQIALPNGAKGRKFDDSATHGLSHCMKAVDFVVELKDRTLFIEVKDPEQPGATRENREKFYNEVRSGSLDENLKTKNRDSFLYEWASGRGLKPIYYLVLLGASSLSEAELLARTDLLKRKLPLSGPAGKAWEKPFVNGCAVMNIEAWNGIFPDFRIKRVSAT